jgi:ribonuclease Z
MGKLFLKCFGVGDGWPCADRDHSSLYYRIGKISILVDCGEGLSRSFKAAGFPYDSPDHIFISHLHSDHTAGFFMFMQGLWLERRTKPLTVSMPAEGVKVFRRMLEAGYIYPELLSFRARFKALRARRPINVGPVKVTPFHSSHLDQLRLAFQKRYHGKHEAFCFRIEAGRLRIGHSADIGSPADLAPVLDQPLDVLVCELAHFQPEEMFRYLQGRKVKRIVFVHLARPYWDDLELTRQLAGRMLPGIPITFAKDGEEITF